MPLTTHIPCMQATLMLTLLVPMAEPMGWRAPHAADTLLGYSYTWPAGAAIAISALLGLLVSLSTFLVIGATSSLTYNVVGGNCVGGTSVHRVGGRQSGRVSGCHHHLGPTWAADILCRPIIGTRSLLTYVVGGRFVEGTNKAEVGGRLRGGWRCNHNLCPTGAAGQSKAASASRC